jgi:excisionase family DNA binding protein
VDLIDLPATITVEEAGELLGLSRSAAYRAASEGQLPTIRFGRKLKVPTPRLLALLGAPAERPTDREPASPWGVSGT